jgi:flagellar biosynthesis activator protein FlaF
MQNAAQAYNRTHQQTSNPRELEATILLRAASRFQAIRDHWPARRGDLDEAFAYNRKLWTIFVGSVTAEECPLPKDIRSNIANLGFFVFNHQLGCIGLEDPAKLDVLISINRSLALGLRGSGADPLPR